MIHLDSRPPGLVDKVWDTDNFGFPVHECLNPRADTAELISTLSWCRQNGGGLMYWIATAGVEVPPSVITEFRGILVDRKTTYQRSLHGSEPVPSGRWKAKEIPKSPASEDLLTLGLVAGEFSRFRVDPRFPRSSFEVLYRLWTERSTLREIADTVLVVGEPHAKPDGMITIGLRHDSAEVGLVAVSAATRGLGVGGALMASAHSWMRQQDAQTARVVTQGANLPACALYEKWGYSISSVSSVYHFWPGLEESQ